MHKWLARAALAAGGAAGLAALAYTAWWFVTAGALKNEVLAWADARRALGYEVAMVDLGVSGFPLSMRVRIDGLAVEQPSGTTPWHWRVRRIIGTTPLTGGDLDFRLYGPQTLTVWAAGEERVLDFDAHRFCLALTPGQDREPGSLYVDVVDLVVAPPVAMRRSYAACSCAPTRVPATASFPMAHRSSSRPTTSFSPACCMDRLAMP